MHPREKRLSTTNRFEPDVCRPHFRPPSPTTPLVPSRIFFPRSPFTHWIYLDYFAPSSPPLSPRCPIFLFVRLCSLSSRSDDSGSSIGGQCSRFVATPFPPEAAVHRAESGSLDVFPRMCSRRRLTLSPSCSYLESSQAKPLPKTATLPSSSFIYETTSVSHALCIPSRSLLCSLTPPDLIALLLFHILFPSLPA